jgi:hypothetical protein
MYMSYIVRNEIRTKCNTISAVSKKKCYMYMPCYMCYMPLETA